MAMTPVSSQLVISKERWICGDGFPARHRSRYGYTTAVRSRLGYRADPLASDENLAPLRFGAGNRISKEFSQTDFAVVSVARKLLWEQATVTSKITGLKSDPEVVELSRQISISEAKARIAEANARATQAHANAREAQVRIMQATKALDAAKPPG